jgi:hypothetical protein
MVAEMELPESINGEALGMIIQKEKLLRLI